KNNKKKKLSILINSMTKKLFINDKEIKKHAEYIGNLKVIIFSPDTVRVLKEGPGNRRRFLNIELSQLYNIYVNILNDYNSLLKQRNEYLKNIKLTNNFNKIYMDIINDRYVSLNISIIKYRYNFVNKINEYISDIYYNIAGDNGLKIKYVPCIKYEEESIMRENLLSKIRNSYDREILLGSSIIGSHREDFGFYLDDLDLSLYGSQGQVKMAILSLKLAEAFVFKDICDEYPVLLLDDVFSELDVNKRNNLIKYLNFDIQSIITTTDLNDIDNEFASKANIYKVENCSVTIDNNREKV
ncbi:MAG: DNA replication and repair protein RecF, partial [Acholeplasmatales bacterium]|nr:DNA replication and repair protein RecF [Acholeplasmatales bacterium]